MTEIKRYHIINETGGIFDVLADKIIIHTPERYVLLMNEENTAAIVPITCTIIESTFFVAR